MALERTWKTGTKHIVRALCPGRRKLRTEEILKLGRNQIIIGNWLNYRGDDRILYRMGLFNSETLCQDDVKTASHILFNCGAVAKLRYEKTSHFPARGYQITTIT